MSGKRLGMTRSARRLLTTDTIELTKVFLRSGILFVYFHINLCRVYRPSHHFLPKSPGTDGISRWTPSRADNRTTFSLTPKTAMKINAFGVSESEAVPNLFI